MSGKWEDRVDEGIWEWQYISLELLKKSYITVEASHYIGVGVIIVRHRYRCRCRYR